MFAITERLLLRPGWAEDAPALSRAIGDQAIAHNLAHVPWPYTLGDAERFLARPPVPGRPNFLVFLRDTAELVGGIGVHGEDTPELGYWIARAHWGKRLAREAGRAVVDLCDASLRLPRLAAAHAIDNPASGRVLARLGFRPTGACAEYPSLGRGRPVTVSLYARERLSAPHGELTPMAA